MKTAMPNSPAGRRAFSLLEVMIAVGVFFMAVFAILGLVSSSLENARRLQRPMVDASMIASELSLTNKLTEGTMSGDFGELYPGYTWTGVVTEEQTNRLFRVDYIVKRSDGNVVMSQMSVLFFRPQSAAGSLDGATK